jgi:hypothetical protein
MDAAPGWPRDIGRPCPGSEGRRRQQREGQDIGRATLAHVLGVQRGELPIVGQDHPERGGRRRGDRVEGRGRDTRDLGRGKDARDAMTDVDVDPPSADVDRPRHDAEEPPSPDARRRDSSSTTVFWG